MSHRSLPLLLASLAVLLLTSLANAGGVPPRRTSPPKPSVPPGTQINVTNVAGTIFTETRAYKWRVEKDTPPRQVPYVILKGESDSAVFSITGIRSTPFAAVEQGPITGEVCIRNVGRVPTRGLVLAEQLEVLKAGRWLPVSRIAIPARAPLFPGRVTCLPYQFAVPLVPGLAYRSHAIVTLANLTGSVGRPRSLSIFADVLVNYRTILVDAQARISDLFECPDGFTCTPVKQGWFIYKTSTLTVEVQLTNHSAPCGRDLEAVSQAALQTPDTGAIQESSAKIRIFTGSCAPEAVGK